MVIAAIRFYFGFARKTKIGYTSCMFKDFLSPKKSPTSTIPTIVIEDSAEQSSANRFFKKGAPVTSYAGSSLWETEDLGGSLAVDVRETDDALLVYAPMAGVAPTEVRIGLSGDLLTIRGVRQKPKIAREARAFHEECYWGNFSRSIVLPVAVEESRVQAELNQGVLEIILPKKIQPKTETVIKIRST